jgi:hypothetical protein
MYSQSRVRTARKLFLAVAGVLTLGLLASAVQAQGPGKLGDTSLKLIPADAATYGAMFRNKEQIEAIAKSKAWARLTSLPAFQMAWKKVQDEYANGQLAGLRQFYEQPENKELVALLADAVSNEIFVYGGESFVGFVNLMTQLQGSMQFGRLTQLGKGPADQTQAQIASLLEALKENQELIKIPDVIVGFKISDPKKAENQLKRLQTLGEMLANQVPEFKGRVKRTKVGEANLVTLELDGSMVPWDRIPFKDFEEKPGEYAPLVKKLRALKLTVSVGVRDGYLLLALAPSPEVVARLGGKGPKLMDRSELKPLWKYADRRIISVGYASKGLTEATSTTKKDVDGMVEMVKNLLTQAPIDDKQRKRIDKDLEELAKDVKKYVPELGAVVSFGFLTDRGQESYSYNYGQHPSVDGTKPLELLNHVGGNPILAVVGRSKPSPEAYQTFVKWVKKAYGHAEEAFLPQLGANEKDQYEEFKKAFFPLLKRLDETTAKMLIPALADGQSGFVLDAKWSSKQWVKLFLPATEKALPLPEPAVVLGVSDAALLRKAMGEYRQILNEIIAKVHDLDPSGNVPDVKIPAPESAKVKDGTLYFYPLPPFLDEQIVPTAGLSDRVAVLTLSKAQAERLLATRPLKVEGGPLADYARKPLASAAYFDWPALLDAASPWIEMGTKAIAANAGVDEGKPTEDILKQVRTVVEVLKVFRGYSSATYLEDGTLVTHGETVIRDL